MKLVATCCSLKDRKKNFHKAKSNGETGKLEPLTHASPAGCTRTWGVPLRARMQAGDQGMVRISILTGWRMHCVNQVGPES